MMMVALTLLMGVAFTSCMDNGDGGNSADAASYVTVVENSMSGGVTLLTDDGFKLIPSNSEVLKVSATAYIERALVGIKWAEGVVFDGDRNKSYKMTIVAPLEAVNTRKSTNMIDTIKTTYPLVALSDGLSGANGRYLTVAFDFNYKSLNEVAFELYPVKAENDQLTMKLCQTAGSKESFNSPYKTLMSFGPLPTAREINELLVRYNGENGVEGGMLTVPNNDSISVKIIADGTNESVLATKFVKVKIIE